jgi:hypothetical protein
MDQLAAVPYFRDTPGILALFEDVLAKKPIDLERIHTVFGIVYRHHNLNVRVSPLFMVNCPENHVTWLGAIWLMTTFRLGAHNSEKILFWYLLELCYNNTEPVDGTDGR